MTNLSPAAQAFWGSAIRHVLTAVAGFLVTHGYVSQSGANAYIEELVGVILQAAVMGWSNRTVYWQYIHSIVARAMPEGTSATVVDAKVAALQTVKALPSVFTPADVTPILNPVPPLPEKVG